jgi:thiopurine S-methyltransferase
MDKAFWIERWRRDEIGFHLPRPHPLLVRFVATYGLVPDATVFVPLCGKSLDIGYLASLGYRVVGVELSELAVEQLFRSLGITPQVTRCGHVRRWQAGRVTVFEGDFFELTASALGPVDLVFDRAALVALTPAMRERYSARMIDVTRAAPQLLISFEYPQAQMQGPPFSVAEPELTRLYGRDYDLTVLHRQEINGGAGRLRAHSLSSLVEVAWRLTPRPRNEAGIGGRNRG